MVKVWAARITPLFDKTNYAFYYEKLPEWRKEKADRLKSENAKAQSVGAWSLWTRLQQQEKLGEDTPFNLSHSGEYVLCAFSDRKEAQVGCDLEMIGEYREKVAKRFFCGEEYAHIIGTDSEEERKELFYRYWVLKESFMKATRRGMGLSTRAFRIDWDGAGRPVLGKQPGEYPGIYHYCEYSHPQIPGRMAVCTTDPRIDEELHLTELDREGVVDEASGR